MKKEIRKCLRALDPNRAFQSIKLYNAGLYVPVAWGKEIPIFLALATSKRWCAHLEDIKCASFYASLPESKDGIRMKLPTVEGVPRAKGNIVRVVKSIDGSREALKWWYELPSKAMKKTGLRRVQSVHCSFIGTF